LNSFFGRPFFLNKADDDYVMMLIGVLLDFCGCDSSMMIFCGILILLFLVIVFGNDD